MNTTTSLEEALALALKLAPKERLQLIEQVALSVEREIEATSSGEEQPEQHWGKSLNRLMDEIGPIEMLYRRSKTLLSGLSKFGTMSANSGQEIRANDYHRDTRPGESTQPAGTKRTGEAPH